MISPFRKNKKIKANDCGGVSDHPSSGHGAPSTTAVGLRDLSSQTLPPSAPKIKYKGEATSCMCHLFRPRSAASFWLLGCPRRGGWLYSRGRSRGGGAPAPTLLAVPWFTILPQGRRWVSWHHGRRRHGGVLPLTAVLAGVLHRPVAAGVVPAVFRKGGHRVGGEGESELSVVWLIP